MLVKIGGLVAMVAMALGATGCVVHLGPADQAACGIEQQSAEARAAGYSSDDDERVYVAEPATPANGSVVVTGPATPWTPPSYAPSKPATQAQAPVAKPKPPVVKPGKPIGVATPAKPATPAKDKPLNQVPSHTPVGTQVSPTASGTKFGPSGSPAPTDPQDPGNSVLIPSHEVSGTEQSHPLPGETVMKRATAR